VSARPSSAAALGAVLGLEREGGCQHVPEVLRRVATRMRLAQGLERLLGQLAGQQLVQRGAEPEHVEAGFGATSPASSGRYPGVPSAVPMSVGRRAGAPVGAL
jgi:hypothetical protein